MKKLLAILLAAILCVGLMAGCGQLSLIHISEPTRRS